NVRSLPAADSLLATGRAPSLDVAARRAVSPTDAVALRSAGAADRRGVFAPQPGAPDRNDAHLPLFGVAYPAAVAQPAVFARQLAALDQGAVRLPLCDAVVQRCDAGLPPVVAAVPGFDEAARTDAALAPDAVAPTHGAARHATVPAVGARLATAVP